MKLALPLRQFRPHRCVAQTTAAAVAMRQQQLLLVLMALAVRFLRVFGDAHWLGSEVAEHVTMRHGFPDRFWATDKLRAGDA